MTQPTPPPTPHVRGGSGLLAIVLILALLAIGSVVLAQCQANQARIADSKAAIEYQRTEQARAREEARTAIAAASQENRTERFQSFLAFLASVTVIRTGADLASNTLIPLALGLALGALLILYRERNRP